MICPFKVEKILKGSLDSIFSPDEPLKKGQWPYIPAEMFEFSALNDLQKSYQTY